MAAQNMFGLNNNAAENMMKMFSAWSGNVQSFRQIPMNETGELLSKSITTGFQLYDAWLEGIQNLCGAGFDICKKVCNGESSDATCITDTTTQMCENIMNRMIQSVKDTPLKGTEPIVEGMEQIVVNLKKQSNGQNMMKPFLQSGIDMGASGVRYFKTSYQGMSELWHRQQSAPEATA